MKKIAFLTILISFVSICYTNALAQNSTSCCDRKGVRVEETKSCCKDSKACCKDSKACCKDSKACCKDSKSCNKETKSCCKDSKACCKDSKACCKDSKSCNKEMKSCCKDSKACCKDSKACCKDSKACNKEMKSCCKDTKACNKDSKACCKEMKSCCKDTKACNKDSKSCNKDTKACNKDSKSCNKEVKACNKEVKSCCNDKCVKIKDGQTCCEKPHCIYCFKVKDIEGNVVSMKEYRGKVLLIVNVASKCGLTPQYEGLEKLYKKYKDKGLEILAFPCNQFLGQEPGTNEEIKKFCSGTYDVTFPMFDKIDVNGQNESPLYTFLKKSAPFKGYPKGAEEFGKQLEQIHQKSGTNFDKGDAIKWNFGKFLVSKDGKSIERFEPMVEPKDLEKEIERMLK